MNPITIPKVPFYFMRHGETEWNKKRLAMGRRSISLNALGKQQAQASIPYLEELNISTIIVSPLKRTLETTNIINASLEKSVVPKKAFQACCFGTLEGKPDVPWRNIWRDWRSGTTPLGGESFEDFRSRIERGLIEVLKTFEPPILIVSHSGPYATLCLMLNLPVISLSNCQIMFHKPPIKPNSTWFSYSIQPELASTYIE